MTKVAEPAPPAPPTAQPTRTREPPFLVTFYRSAIAKKWLMAISGIVLLGFVFAHMIGNLKLFLGESHLNAYAEWLRDFGEPAFPRSFLLWCLRQGGLQPNAHEEHHGAAEKEREAWQSCLHARQYTLDKSDRLD